MHTVKEVSPLVIHYPGLAIGLENGMHLLLTISWMVVVMVARGSG